MCHSQLHFVKQIRRRRTLRADTTVDPPPCEVGVQEVSGGRGRGAPSVSAVINLAMFRTSFFFVWNVFIIRLKIRLKKRITKISFKLPKTCNVVWGAPERNTAVVGIQKTQILNRVYLSNPHRMDDRNLARKKRARKAIFRACTCTRYGEMAARPFSCAATQEDTKIKKLTRFHN